MVIPPQSASGPAVAASLLSPLPDLSGIGFLFSDGDRAPDSSGDEALLAQITLSDPSVRSAALREIDRRLAGDIPEDAETTAGLKRLRDVLRRIEEAPRAPTLAIVPAEDVPARRAVSILSKDVADPLRALAAAAPAPAGFANPELMDRVPRASRLMRSRGISRLRLVLDPPELGEVRLDLTLRLNLVSGTFQADTPAAAEALLSRLDELKDALEKRGLAVGELSVLAAGSEASAPPRPSPPPTAVAGTLDLKA